MAIAGRTSPRNKAHSAAIKAPVKKRPSAKNTGKTDTPIDSEKQAQAARVSKRLRTDYPAATCALENETPFELLLATILSAHCTGEPVNLGTPELFRRWPTAREMADAPIKQLEKVIQSTGFF